jgi:hypothetical protein
LALLTGTTRNRKVVLETLFGNFIVELIAWKC